MRTTAELLRKITHRHDAHRLAVLLIKQRHRTCLFRLVHRHDLCLHSDILSNLLIDHLLDCCQLVSRHRLKVAEVKTRTLAILIRSFLLYMRAEHFAECLLQQVCR